MILHVKNASLVNKGAFIVICENISQYLQRKLYVWIQGRKVKRLPHFIQTNEASKHLKGFSTRIQPSLRNFREMLTV